MAGAMLIILAAAQAPALRDSVRESGPVAGKHLLPLLDEWGQILDNHSSPSVEQSVYIIREVSRYLEDL